MNIVLRAMPLASAANEANSPKDLNETILDAVITLRAVRGADSTLCESWRNKKDRAGPQAAEFRIGEVPIMLAIPLNVSRGIMAKLCRPYGISTPKEEL